MLEAQGVLRQELETCLRAGCDGRTAKWHVSARHAARRRARPDRARNMSPLIKTSLNRLDICSLRRRCPRTPGRCPRTSRQPMRIEADRVELDDTTGMSTYRGNVKENRGHAGEPRPATR